jgi:hypothetical protein
MAIETATLGQLTEDQRELVVLMRSVSDGDPQPYIERYFKIENDKGELVPMLFSNEPNQQAYYSSLKAQLSQWLVDVLCMKDRKARWTSFVAAILAAKFFVKPPTHIFWVANAEDTFTVAHKHVDTFYRNLPDFARPEIKGNEWGQERKVLRFPTPEGGELTSTFTLRTANNPHLGSGETPTDLVFDEYGKFPETFGTQAQASVRASLSSYGSFWRGGTVGPQGPTGPMYDEVQEIKRGERQTIYLFRRCWDNPANHLTPGHRLRRPVDNEDASIKPGVNAGPGGNKEEIVVNDFPDDGIPMEWRLAQRRAWMREALLAAGGPGNEEAAGIIFAREHCEDDQTPWMIAGRSQFNREKIELQTAIAQSIGNSQAIDETIRELSFDAWQDYNPAHTYIFGGDLGSGTGGDDTSFQIFDDTAALFVGELHGNLTDPYQAVVAALEALGRFGKGVFVLETNRFPGIGNHVKNTLDYENTFKPPMRQGEKFETWLKRPFGINVGATHHSEKEPSADELNGMFKAAFNQGAFKVLNPKLLETMRMWNPTVEKHTPDRIAGARLCLIGRDMAKEIAPITGTTSGGSRDNLYRHLGRAQRRHTVAASGGRVWGT